MPPRADFGDNPFRSTVAAHPLPISAARRPLGAAKRRPGSPYIRQTPTVWANAAHLGLCHSSERRNSRPHSDLNAKRPFFYNRRHTSGHAPI
jgi:hypothetical protein